ncbi:4-hydroxythreonine-4-phosphate dehydrogenase (EC 1.1.1.262), partial [Candidatus Synechococcus spongiarum]
MDEPRRIAIALGDPAGIGSEVVLKALANRRVQQTVEPVLFCCRRWLLE